MLGGFFFLLVVAIGLLRLPDVFTRMHALGKCDTLGTGMVLFALFFLSPGLTEKMKIILIVFMTAVINPVMTHLIAKVVFKRQVGIAAGTWLVDNYGSSDKSGGKDIC